MSTLVLTAVLSLTLDTHLHADHISGGLALASKTGARYHLNPADAPGSAISYVPLQDSQSFMIGSRKLETIHSPGHTPGSTSFLLDKTHLFTTAERFWF